MKKACIFNLFHGTLYICLLQKYDTWEKLSHYFLYIFLLCNFWPSYSPCALHSVLAFSTGKWKWKSLSHVWFLVPHGLYSPWNSPGQNNGLSSRSLLQGIFPSQGLNPGLLHCRQIPYQLSHQGSPRILEWVAYAFSSRSSWPRNWTRISWIAGGFFISWATFSIGVTTNQSPHKNAHLLLRGQARWKSRDDHWIGKIVHSELSISRYEKRQKQQWSCLKYSRTHIQDFL